MKLRDVYETPGAYDVLWQLLCERTPNQSISHRKMPSWEEHKSFIESRPYECWLIIDADSGESAGAVYLTRAREVGIGVLLRHRGTGLAKRAIAEMLRQYPGRTLANINPANEASIALFRKLGFGGPIQITLEKP